VSRFAEQAETILAAAESAGECSPMTILIGPNGIRMIAESDWPLDSLLWHHGADTAYRVSETGGRIRVEGHERSRSCILESTPHRQTAHFLLKSGAANPGGEPAI